MNSTSKLISDVFEIKNDLDGKFTKAVSITLPFDIKNVDFDKSVVGIYWLNEETQKWILLDNIQVDKVNATVTGSVDHFTKFAVLATAKPTIPPISIVFSDISGHWAEAKIRQAGSIGIVGGYSDGTFKPNAAVTRAEFAVMLMNSVKPQGVGAALTFIDTAQIGAWAQKAIAQAVQAGIISGYEDGSFRPDTEITRAEMAAMIANALDESIAKNAITGFADEENIPAWAKGSVAYVKQAGIVQGKGDNRFAPQDHATRAEVVAVLVNMLAQKNE
ncbi:MULTISPECIES: S-layer homology domain-containing protein [unclassified Paenibacillus]|uniref:S-layer homology domain-containing protein n=1 Tax=unclassified Paenibacillus TaxID=185978 RepID=UPI0027D899CE|nr:MULTISPECIES: S-layer homology domain-containing protein [unclassified Paenibacillus]